MNKEQEKQLKERWKKRFTEYIKTKSTEDLIKLLKHLKGGKK